MTHAQDKLLTMLLFGAIMAVMVGLPMYAAWEGINTRLCRNIENYTQAQRLEMGLTLEECNKYN